MLETHRVESIDGSSIAYDVSGEGLPLILLHGFTNDRRETWHDFGIVERLAEQFRVVTMDLRGCGESTRSGDPARYEVSLHRADVLAVADACGFEHFGLWGFALGAVLTLQMAAECERVSRAVASGSHFGEIFTLEYVRPHLEYWEQIAVLASQDRLDELDPAQQHAIEQLDPHVMLARWHAVSHWPVISPEQLLCPTLLLAGSDDGDTSAVLRQQQVAIKAAGHEVHIFEGVDQAGLVSEVDTVLPVVTAFLKRNSWPPLS